MLCAVVYIDGEYCLTNQKESARRATTHQFLHLFICRTIYDDALENVDVRNIDFTCSTMPVVYIQRLCAPKLHSDNSKNRMAWKLNWLEIRLNHATLFYGCIG